MESEPGAGSSFSFSASFGREEALEEPLSLPAASMTALVADEGLGAKRLCGRLLLVEDNPVNQELARTMLELIGCKVEVAGDGLQAVVKVLQRPDYSLVLMDVQMPELDGYAATRRIRELEQSEGRLPLPIIAMTANAMEGDREKCWAAGMDDYLAKPFTMEQLTGMVRKHLPTVTAAPMAEIAVAAEDYDRGALARIRALERPGSPPLLQRVVTLFDADAGSILEELHRDVTAGNAEGVRLAAHRFKSGSANLGALRLARFARELESLGQKGELQGAALLLGEMEIELTRVQNILREEIRV